jgi:hypothetical protein
MTRRQNLICSGNAALVMAHKADHDLNRRVALEWKRIATACFQQAILTENDQ